MSAGDAETGAAGQIVGILLAAGRGRRFDGTGQRNKLLQCLPEGKPADAAIGEHAGSPVGMPVVVHSVRTLQACLPRVLAVVPAGSDELAGILAGAGCEVTMCADADAGMGHSLAHAVRHSEQWEPAGWLIALADMPWVQVSTLQALLAVGTGVAPPPEAPDRPDCTEAGAISNSPANSSPNRKQDAGMVAPCWQGQRGNPVFIPRQYLPDLLALSGDQGARALLQRFPPHLIAVDDPGIVRDIDTPADLARTFLA